MSPIVTPEQLAEIAYTAYVQSFHDPMAREHGVLWTWENLTNEGKRNWTAAAIAIQHKVESMWAISHFTLQSSESSKIAERFREAVELAFRQMSIRSAADTAAWYTLRDWLRDQDDAINTDSVPDGTTTAP